MAFENLTRRLTQQKRTGRYYLYSLCVSDAVERANKPATLFGAAA